MGATRHDFEASVAIHPTSRVGRKHDPELKCRISSSAEVGHVCDGTTRDTRPCRTRQISPAPNPPWKVTRPPDGAWMPAHVPVGRNVCCQTFSMLHKTRLPSRRLAPDPARYNFVFCTLSYVCHTHLSA